MKRVTRRLLIAGLVASSLPAAWANLTTDDSVVRGSVLVKTQGGQWQSSSEFKPGSWVKAADSDATINVGGVTMRMTKGSTAYLASVQPGQVDIKLGKGNGRVFVSVPEGVNMNLDSGADTVKASSGQFVVRYGKTNDLKVFSGNAQGTKVSASMPLASAWLSDRELAVLGPETRTQPASTRVQDQGTQNRNTGEDTTRTQQTQTQQTQQRTWDSNTNTNTSNTNTNTRTTDTSVRGGNDNGLMLALLGLGGFGLGFGASRIANNGDNQDVQFITSNQNLPVFIPVFASP